MSESSGVGSGCRGRAVPLLVLLGFGTVLGPVKEDIATVAAAAVAGSTRRVLEGVERVVERGVNVTLGVLLIEWLCIGEGSETRVPVPGSVRESLWHAVSRVCDVALSESSDRVSNDI